MKEEIKTGQQILDQAREDWLKAENVTGDIYDAKAIKNAIADWWLSWYTSTLQSFIEAEIARLEGMKVLSEEKDGKVFFPIVHADMKRGSIEHVPTWNQALQDQIPHLKEVLVTLKR